MLLGLRKASMDIHSGILLDRGPGLEPPHGIISNFGNPPESYQTTIKIVLAVCLAIASIFSALCLYVNVTSVKRLAIEDYATYLAWVNSLTPAKRERSPNSCEADG